MNKYRLLGLVFALILAAALVTLLRTRPPYILCGSAIAAVGVAFLLVAATNAQLLTARYLRLAILLNPAAFLVAFGLSTASRARPELSNVSLVSGLSAVAFLLLSFVFYVTHVRLRVRK
jgi:hypothetical protein